MIPFRLSKFNTLATGIVCGLIVPVIVYFLLYFTKIQDVQSTLFSHHQMISTIIPVIISHCILPNLLVFLAFNGLNWMQASKGVLGTSVALTVIIFAIKLIFFLI